MHGASPIRSHPADLQYVSEDCPHATAGLAIPPARAVSHRGTLNAAALLTSRVALHDIRGIVAASRLERPPVARVDFGIAQVDGLTGGLPRGGLTEICGAPSSGRTSLMLSAIAQATASGELCAVVDANDSFDPHSAMAAGVDLRRVLWVRCAANADASVRTGTERSRSDVAAVCSTLRQKQAIGSVMPHAKVWYGRSPARSERGNTSEDLGNIGCGVEQNHAADLAANLGESRCSSPAQARIGAADRRYWARCVDQALRTTDLLLQGGGFGMVIIDLGDVPGEMARRVPLTTWFRFRRAVENTPAVLLSIVRQSCAKTCASLVLQMQGQTDSHPGLQARQTGKNCKASACQNLRSTQELPAHTQVLTGLAATIEVARCSEPQQLGKKPPGSARATFESQPEWVIKEKGIRPAEDRTG